MKSEDVLGRIQIFKGVRGKLFLLALVGLLIFTLFLNPFVIVGPGERGVVTTFGHVQDRVLGEGLSLRIPLMQKVILMNVKIQKDETKAAASTRDLQKTHSLVALNYNIVPEKVNQIYQNIGLNYRKTVIDPNVQEVVKAVTARYTAEQLITERDKVSVEIRDALKEKLNRYGIHVDNLSIVDFGFSEQFIQAIEDKQTAEQKALKAQQDLKRIEIEAKQKLTLARAEAESLRLQRAVISDQVIRLRAIEARQQAIEKWDGKMPSVTAGAIPFLDVGGLKR